MGSFGVPKNSFTNNTKISSLKESVHQLFNTKELLELPKMMDSPKSSLISRRTPNVCGKS
jgi:hypothetical protein